MTPSAPASADELLRLFDGELSADAAQALQARLSEQDRATLGAWQRQKEQLQALGATIAAEPLPADLAQAAWRTGQARARVHPWKHRWQRWGGLAASVVLAFGLGWTTRGLEGRAPLAQASAFAGQAVRAHLTYAPEVRHPVEVSAEQQAHLVQWLSKRLGHALQIPSLAPQGYELVGGRLLPGDSGARAQFMFQRADGTRVTLYVGGIEGRTGAATTETAFAFSQHNAVASFYWVDGGLGYALSAPLPRSELLALAEAVHRQL